MRIFLPILLPVLVLAFHTFVVAFVLARARFAEAARRKLGLASFATSRELATLECVAIADNLRNLLEVPVLFYVLAILLMITGQQGTFFVVGAWTYVALRAAHSVVHCTYNDVRHRFYAFASSMAVLVAMWVGFAIAVLI